MSAVGPVYFFRRFVNGRTPLRKDLGGPQDFFLPAQEPTQIRPGGPEGVALAHPMTRARCESGLLAFSADY